MSTYSLKPGDIIDIVAPASGSSLQELEQALWLTRLLGFTPRYDPNIIDPSQIPYCANSNEERFEQLKTALYAEDSKAVWCLRGGYGSQLLLEELIVLDPPAFEKYVIGFSDITALHLFLVKHWGWTSIHGPGLVLQPKLDTSEISSIEQLPIHYQELNNMLTGNTTAYMLHLEPLNLVAQQALPLDSVIYGGNLSLVQVSIGTDWEIKGAGKVLFLEEVGEKGYRVDRSLNHLKNAGLFDDCDAIIFGDFLAVNDADASKLEFALKRFVEDMETSQIPIYKCEGIGHGAINHPFIENGNVSIRQVDDHIELLMHPLYHEQPEVILTSEFL